MPLTVQTGILQIIGTGILFQQFRMRPPGEPAQPTRFGRRIVRGRPADERELVQALVLAIRPVGRYHFLVLGRRQFKLLPGVSFENVVPVRAFPLDPAGCKRYRKRLESARNNSSRFSPKLLSSRRDRLT